MSSFDKRVCLWLNSAAIPDKAKITTLNRMSVGINNCRNLGLEPSATTSAAKSEPSVRVDYALQDSIAKALHRLRDNQKKAEEEEKKPVEERKPVAPITQPLFPHITRESFAARTPGGLTPRGSRPTTPRSRSVATASTRAVAEPSATTTTNAGKKKQCADPPANSAQAAAEAAANNGNDTAAKLAAFSFGDPSANDDSTAAEDRAATRDEDVATGAEDDVMPQHEDEHRRRQTISKRQSRHAISAEIIDQEAAAQFKGESVEKAASDFELVVRTLETHHLFSFLDDADLRTVVDIMQMRRFAPGERVVQAGTPNDVFFVVVEGALVADEEAGLPAMGPGATLGEHGLMYASDSPIGASAAQPGGAQCCTITRETYKKICSKASTIKRARYESFLGNVKFLKGLTKQETLQLADALKSSKYEKGDFLIRHGEEGKWFSIIVEGTVDVVGRNDRGEEVYVCSFGEGSCVGELEFLFNHKTVADVVAKTDVVRTAKMTAQHFEKVIGSAKEVLERQAEDDEVYTYYRSIQNPSGRCH